MWLGIFLTILIVACAGGAFRYLVAYWIVDVCERQVNSLIYFKFVGLSICAALGVSLLCQNVIDQVLLMQYMVLLIMLSLIDGETTYIPNILVMPMVAIGVLGNVCGSFYDTAIFKSGTFSIVSAAAGYGVFWLVNQLYKICADGRDGMGMGDAKLMAAICSLSGIGAFPFVSFVGACSFLMAYGIRSVQSSRAQEQEQAFGPHLAIGASLYFCADFFLWPGHVNGMVLGLFYF
jgi:leader peptidase (prepilin peptidase)/N-methyltransferase